MIVPLDRQELKEEGNEETKAALAKFEQFIRDNEWSINEVEDLTYTLTESLRSRPLTDLPSQK